MTDNEIVKALECLNGYDCKRCLDSGTDCFGESCEKVIAENALALINRQKETIEQLQTALFKCGEEMAEMQETINRQKAKIEKLEKEAEEVRYKLECLLCHSTGGRLSKSTYPLRTMETAVTDYINECYDEVEAEARAEAVKEFAEKLKEDVAKRQCGGYTFFCVGYGFIDNLVKEFTEGGDGEK